MDGRKSILGGVSPILVALGAIVLLGVGVLIGVLIEGNGSQTSSGVLSADQIGNAEKGRELFVSQGCAMCHTYQGRGGSDAPNLDFMRGRMTATEIADMSGLIWNHVPTMKAAFEEEGIPFPEFNGDQMANLIAYLHGGGPPPEVKPEAMGEHMGGEPGDEGSTMHGGSDHMDQGAGGE